MEKPNVKILLSPEQPEYLRDTRAVGRVFGHPRFPDGSEVLTSHIVKRDGNSIETLTTPCMKWCRKSRRAKLPPK